MIEQTPEAVSMLQQAITVIPAGVLVLALLALALVYRPMARAVLG